MIRFLDHLFPYIVLSGGLFGLSTTITYVCWVKFRVWELRQQLFHIRDELWDWARRTDHLHDEAYRLGRRRLNTFIRFAPSLSLAAWRHLAAMTAAKQTEPRPDPQTLAEFRVEQALDSATDAIAGYVYMKTAGGFFYLLYRTFRAIRRSMLMEQMEKETPAARQVFESEKMDEIDLVERCVAAG